MAESGFKFEDRAVRWALQRTPGWGAAALRVAIGAYASQVVSTARARASSRLARRAVQSLSDSMNSHGATITGGGGARLPSGNGNYGDIFFGAEFGGSQPQFRAYRSRGFYFWPALWDAKQRDQLNGALDKIENNWRE